MGYSPKTYVRSVLEKALAYVQSVRYRVTVRWVFYRLLQDGTLGKKGDYKNLLSYLSKARKNFYGGWRPDTLADNTRHAIVRGDEFNSGQDWVDTLAERLDCSLDRWRGQPSYLERFASVR